MEEYTWLLHVVHLRMRVFRILRTVSLQLVFQLVEHAAPAAASEKAVRAGTVVDVVHVANHALLPRKAVAPEQVEDPVSPHGQYARQEQLPMYVSSVSEAGSLRTRCLSVYHSSVSLYNKKSNPTST